jgi:hypothetical protein
MMAARPVTTVIEAADTYDLITLDDFKVDAGITTDADDVYLARAISRASSAIMTYCGRVFAVETVRDDFIESSAGALLLSRYPVISVTEASGVSSGYTIDSARGMILGPGASSSASVTYTAGYESIPLDLQGAVGEIVKALQFNKSRDPSLRSENILSGLYAYTLFDAGSSGAGTAQQVAMILERYRPRIIA